jgi:hypothetical protein
MAAALANLVLLTLVFAQGRVRTSITIEPRTSAEPGGYSKGVLFRISDPNMLQSRDPHSD